MICNVFLVLQMYLLHKTERSAHTSHGIFQGHQDNLLLPKENKLSWGTWGARNTGACWWENHTGQYPHRHKPFIYTRRRHKHTAHMHTHPCVYTHTYPSYTHLAPCTDTLTATLLTVRPRGCPGRLSCLGP